AVFSILSAHEQSVFSDRSTPRTAGSVARRWAYLLVGGGHYVWEEAIESLVNPRQSEMKPIIEPHVAPAHTHPFEALLNQPLTGTFHKATANRQAGGFVMVIANMIFMGFQIGINVD